ncbi:hypothetical protein [Pontibacter vulgaris]|uniref:hypothetical protein n=1 Tax=Pontibacter vulgaris TaxID=2905679 RepID=UPI001FA75E1F|nr:hypothetical protein [Pontibacter vulgaris]
MKRIFILIAAILSIPFASQACDGGCTMGGSYFGILPQFHKNFAGLRYTNRSYTITTTHTHMHEGMPMTHTDIIEEKYSTMEMWGRYVPAKNVQLMAFVPYTFNEQSTTRGNTKYDGLGDVTVMANYTILNTGDSINTKFKHTLQLGGGVKLATGTHKLHLNNEDYTQSLQPGSGSTDYMFNGIYTLRYGKLGLNNDVTYRINSENADGYKFGDRLSASSNLFYWQNIESMTMLPNAGIYFEHAKADELGSDHGSQMGGDSYYANLGLNMYIRKIGLGATVQLPLSTTDDHEVTKGNSRTMVNLTYLF